MMFRRRRRADLNLSTFPPASREAIREALEDMPRWHSVWPHRITTCRRCQAMLALADLIRESHTDG